VLVVWSGPRPIGVVRWTDEIIDRNLQPIGKEGQMSGLDYGALENLANRIVACRGSFLEPHDAATGLKK
jgi:hypothetical protein